MPDPRPLSSMRFGAYDDPPANSETSTPRSRSRRLGRALQGTNELARDVFNPLEYARSRPSLLSPIDRRRRRSPSEQDPFEEPRDMAGSSSASTPLDDGRRQRRPKRRRLDLDESPAPRQGIKYGHFGQVEPGRLRLELVSCDGGEHVDPRSPATYLGAKNLLRHDGSVYCSERKSSNVILRHADDMPFCLEKLHIVGPEHGFTAPIREGLVYVAMTLNDLSKYLDPPPHARLQAVHGPPYHSRRHDRNSLRSSPERLSLADALRDPEVNSALDARERDYARRADAAHDLAGAEESYYGEDFGFGRTDPEAHCELPAFTDSPDVLSPPEAEQAPVTVLSDEDAGPEESTPQEVLDFRLQRMRLMRRRYEVENYDREDRWHGLHGLHFDANARDRDTLYSGPSRLDQLMSRSRIHDSPAPYGYGAAPDHMHESEEHVIKGAELDATSDPNVTCTRFHIKKDKHKVAIRFEPGLSGRFILLKLWAFRNSSNVDVQSVIAKGFGGCRFFPAREPL